MDSKTLMPSAYTSAGVSFGNSGFFCEVGISTGGLFAECGYEKSLLKNK
jgi:hypothetical protein